MRIATWNVNSLKARLPRVEEWLEYAEPDVLALQETKLADKNFPSMAFSGLGYESAPHGHNQWNGVAHPLQGRHRRRDDRASTARASTPTRATPGWSRRTAVA